MRSTALAALARAVALADPGAAERSLMAGWRHAWQRRQVRWALARAGRRLGAQAIAIEGADPVGARVLLLQVAWLELAGAPAESLSPSWVADRYYAELAARQRSAGRRRLRVILVAAVALAVAVGLTLALTGGEDEPLRAAGQGFDSGAERVWADAVTDWVIALDRYSRARADHDDVDTARAELTAFEAKVLSPEVRAFFGPEASDAVADLVTAARTLSTSRHFEHDDEAFGAALLEANHALARAGRAYFFDGHGALYPDGRIETRVFLFRVAARRRWLDRAAGVSVDAVHLRRLDRVNLVQLLIGYTSRRMDVAVVLLDKVEEVLSESILPALPQGAERAIRAPPDAPDDAELAAFRRLGGIAIRDVVGRGFADAYPRLAAAGRALAARTAAFAEAGLHPLGDLRIDPSQRAEIDKLLGATGRARVADAEAQLALPDTEVAATELMARSALGVEHHEVQHRLDYALGDRFTAPAGLLALMGVGPEAVTHDEHDPVMHSAYELSAYTAELARDPPWALINLQSLVEQSLDGDSDEARAAQLLLRGMQDVLSVEQPVTVVGLTHGEATRTALLAAFLAVAPRGAEAISNAARTLYETWFGHPVPTLEEVTTAAPTAAADPEAGRSRAAGDAAP